MKNTIALLSFALLTTTSVVQAQDIEAAKRTIDAEKYESAKQMLKKMIASDADNGQATFLLGNVYLKQSIEDSAKIYFQKGLNAKNDGRFNYIGLGQIDLNNKNVTAAQANFVKATEDLRKREYEELIYVGKAFINSTNPDYKKAIENLNQAKEKVRSGVDAQIELALGDAYYGEKKQNDAYSAYRNAYAADGSLIRAKMQLGVLLKGAKAYPKAIEAFDEVEKANASYGPVYRELAETYYYWANNEPRKYDEYIQKALPAYEKYMKYTDYSLNSRMRHADFLILAKDYKALEVEAKEMQKLDKVNPRILRYLGYSAYENGNIDQAIKSLNEFIANPSSKIIARDYMFLGLAKLKTAVNPTTKEVNETKFTNGVADLKKSVDMEITMTNDLSEIGKDFYADRMYNQASAIYQIVVTNKDSRNFLLDNFYLGNCLYFKNAQKDAVKNPEELRRADTAFGNVIEASPATADAYIYRARTNSMLEDDAATIKYYEDYVRVVTESGADEVAKNKGKIIESYNNIGAAYANTDRTKAIEYFNKTIAIDATNEYANQSIKMLK